MRRASLALMAAVMLLGSPAGILALESSGHGLQVLQDGEDLLIDWRSPLPEIRLDPEGRAVVELAGFIQQDQPGALRLPVASRLLAVPAGATARLEILELQERQVELPGPIAPGLEPQGVLRGANGAVIGGAYASGSGTPGGNVELLRFEDVGILRGIRLGRLVFSPAWQEGSHLRLVQRVRAKIHFEARASTRAVSPSYSDPFLDVAGSLVANPRQLTDAHIKGSSWFERSPAYPEDRPVVAIEVADEGLVAVTRTDLQFIDFPVESLDPNLLHLSRGPSQVAYRWVGDNDASFEEDEQLLFFAKPGFSRWTTADTYLLWEGDDTGLRMETRSADPAGLANGVAWRDALAEINTIYTPDKYAAPIPAGRDGDRWAWQELTYSEPVQAHHFSIQLLSMDAAQIATLTVWLIGYTDVPQDPDHRVAVALNGNSLGEVLWNGKNAITTEFSVPAGTLLEGENDLALSLPGLEGVSVEGAWLDAFSLRYAVGSASAGDSVAFSGEAEPRAYEINLQSTVGWQAYDVTSPNFPLILEGVELTPTGTLRLGDGEASGVRQYWAGSQDSIASPTRIRLVSRVQTGDDPSGAEYLIVTPSVFLPAAQELGDYRRSRGLSVAIVDLQAIYDTYGYGRAEPEAIKSFLANAYSNWVQPPLYVVLMGDGTADPKRYLATSSETFVPPYLADVDPWAGETATDNRYVTVDGEDLLPDMLIGRLPANSLEEAQVMVDKIISYESQPRSETWSSLAAYVADDKDAAGNFPVLLDNLIEAVPGPTLLPVRRYFDPEGNTIDQFRASLRKTWTDGSSLMVYAGHASIHQWAAENFMHLEDIPSLDNQARLPVLLEMTCFTGAFQVPGYETFDETLLRHPGGGVVAAWGPSGLGLSSGQRWLAEGFLQDTFGRSGSVLGTATLAGRVNLAGKGYYPDLIDTFILFGDPAMPVATSHLALMPLIQR